VASADIEQRKKIQKENEPMRDCAKVYNNKKKETRSSWAKRSTMMLEASVQWALLTALLLVMQSTPTLCGNNTTNTTTTTTAHLTTTAKINPKPTPKTTHTPRPPHTPFPSDGNFVELNFTLPNDSNGTASNTSMCATCATGVVPFAAAHALRQWSVAFTNPIPVGLGFLLDQVIATVYGAWPCATRKRFNDTASSVLLTINSVVVAETSLPTRNSSCDCRNCAEPLVFTGLRSAALWQNTYYQNNHLSIIVTSPEPIWFSFVDVRFHYSEPTDVVVYYTPIGGPISGDTNVTVLGDFEPGTLYNCYFGRVPSVAQPLQSDNGTSSYQVACLAPLSIADGRVRFSVIEATASADGRRKRRFLAQPAALPVRGGGGVERLPAAGDHVPPNAPGGGNFFHYYKKPTFLSFSPTSGGPAGGYDVNITGTNFLNFDSYMYCMFGEQPAIATYVSNTTVTCTAPGGMGSVHLMYSQNNQQFDSVGTFTYVAPLTSDTVYLSFLQVGLIAGGALAARVDSDCRRPVHQLQQAPVHCAAQRRPDGEAEEQTINVAQIQLLARIGKGSFAEVFRATWRGSEIAVKKLPARAVDEEMRADFEGEAALMSRLAPPELPAVSRLVQRAARHLDPHRVHAARLALPGAARRRPAAQLGRAAVDAQRHRQGRRLPARTRADDSAPRPQVAQHSRQRALGRQSVRLWPQSTRRRVTHDDRVRHAVLDGARSAAQPALLLRGARPSAAHQPRLHVSRRSARCGRFARAGQRQPLLCATGAACSLPATAPVAIRSSTSSRPL
jgi:hypothetical protein